MNKIKARDFWRSPYKYLKDLPIVVTKNNIDTYIIRQPTTQEIEICELESELSSSQIEEIRSRPCSNCGFDKLGWSHVHHVKLKSEGGTNHRYNLIPLCPNCHYLTHSGKIDVVTKYVEEKDKLVVTSKDVVTLVSVTPAPNEPPPYKVEEPWQPPSGLSKDFMTSKGKARKDPE